MTEKGKSPFSFDRLYGVDDGESAPEIVRSLETLLQEFREAVEIAWNKNTVNAQVVGSGQIGRFHALGQCAPTARLLKDVILQRFPDLTVTSQRGKVGKGEDSENTDHVWLEIPLADDTLIVDVTSDQAKALGNKSPRIILDTKKHIKERHGVTYKAVHEDTDEVMQGSSSRSFERYKKLSRRYARVKEDLAYYRELFNSNIFILAPAGAGKTTLLSYLAERMPHTAIDVGKLFRAVAHFILTDASRDAIRPDISRLRGEESEAEKNRIFQALFKYTRTLERELRDTSMRFGDDSKVEVLHRHLEITSALDSDDVEALVPVIAQSPKVRALIWEWIHNFAKKNGGTIITGHTLKDIDTTRYRTVRLTVSDDVAVERLVARNGITKDEALAQIASRDGKDNIAATGTLIERNPSIVSIDTSELTPSQVGWRTLTGLVRKAREKTRREAYQRGREMARERFSWEVNPLIAGIRTVGRQVFDDIASRYSERGITTFDVAVQTLMHLAGRKPEEVWIDNDPPTLSDIVALLEAKDGSGAVTLMQSAIEQGVLVLNTKLVETEALRQAESLVRLYRQTPSPDPNVSTAELAAYMGNMERSPFREAAGGHAPVISIDHKIVNKYPGASDQWVVTEKASGKRIVLKPVPSEINKQYGMAFHYLHGGRSDELMAFGAFIEGDKSPFAWVSYSPVDRSYKQEMLTYKGVEPHRVVEMTRAWNSIWSPKNTMSVLFSYAHATLQERWKEEVAKGMRDKPLAGVLTAINGNLGFRANAFNGVGFQTCAEKPAHFTFRRNDDDTLTYMSRRALVASLGLESTADLATDHRATTEQFPLLPTYEMLLLFNKRDHEAVAAQSVYSIPDDAYERSA